MGAKCKLCDKVYVWSHDLKRHMKTKHQDVSVQQQQQQQQELSAQPQLIMYGLKWEVNEKNEKKIQVPNFMHPFTCMVSGPTSSGKSTFISKLLELSHEKIYPAPEKVIWCYSQWQPLYDSMIESVEFHQGMPDNIDSSVRNLLILDDLMSDVDESVTELFTKGSHHRNISVIYIVQNLFHQGKEHRTISLNCQYMVLFKNPRDASQINHLARQMYPQNSAYMSDVYNEATKSPFGYLFVDVRQETEENLRLRSNILEPIQYIYVRKE